MKKIKILLLYPPEQSWPGTMVKPNGSLAYPYLGAALKNIDIEIQNWKNLKFNSEKMSKELSERINKVKIDLENIDKLPEQLSIKKGQLMENTSTTENEKQNLYSGRCSFGSCYLCRRNPQKNC